MRLAQVLAYHGHPGFDFWIRFVGNHHVAGVVIGLVVSLAFGAMGVYANSTPLRKLGAGVGGFLFIAAVILGIPALHIFWP